MKTRARLIASSAIALLLFAAACIRAPHREVPVPTLPAPVPAALPDTISIGLAVGRTSVVVNLPAGSVMTGSTDMRRIGSGSDVRLVADTGGVRCGDLGVGLSERIRIQPDPGRFLSWNGTRYRGDFFVLAGVDSAGAPILTLVNVLPLDDYLRAVVPKEIGIIRDEHLEAMKAQAVTARTYSVRNKGRRAALGFDLFATPEDQVYGGVNAETASTSLAVEQTRGEILVYHGDLVEAYYHSTCGGRTASMQDVWNVDRPYLRGGPDMIGDTFACAISKYFRWTETYRGETFARLAAPADTVCIRVLERDAGGRCLAVEIARGDSKQVVRGDWIRKTIRRPDGTLLRSNWFDVRSDSKGIVLEGRGWGHGIGMCQMGAIGRARAGQTYREILAVYYPGTEIKPLRDGRAL